MRVIAKVKNGVIVLPDGISVPDGTPVKITVLAWPPGWTPPDSELGRRLAGYMETGESTKSIEDFSKDDATGTPLD